jgi:hypothetical protein
MTQEIGMLASSSRDKLVLDELDISIVAARGAA